jgi:small subunit ribosomal protein S1
MAIENINMLDEVWRDIYASRQNKKILTGMLSAVEKYKLNGEETECGVIFNGSAKVIIPINEMGTREDRQILRSMIGGEIDYIVYGINTEDGIAVASRKAAQKLRQQMELPKHKAGDRVLVRIVGVGRYSVIADCYGLEVHIPREEIDYGFVDDPANYVQIGDRVPAVIKEIDLSEAEPKVKLSLKDAKPDPFIQVPVKYRQDGEYLATVSGIPGFGIFANLEQGVSALCPIPAWSDFNIEVGDKVLIKIKKINPEERKIYASLIRLIRKGGVDSHVSFR